MNGADRASSDIVVEHAASDAVVVRLIGEHDLAERGEIRSLFESLLEVKSLVVADLSEATFVDSTILHLLVEADIAARRLGRAFRVQLATAAIIARAFELTGLRARLHVVGTKEEALARNAEPR